MDNLKEYIRGKRLEVFFLKIRKEILLLKKVLISILIGLIVIGAVIAAVIIVNQNREQEETGLTTIQLNEVTRSVFYAPQYVAIANRLF